MIDVTVQVFLDMFRVDELIGLMNGTFEESIHTSMHQAAGRSIYETITGTKGVKN
mgnify:CR=1 FL=1